MARSFCKSARETASLASGFRVRGRFRFGPLSNRYFIARSQPVGRPFPGRGFLVVASGAVGRIPFRFAPPRPCVLPAAAPVASGFLFDIRLCIHLLWGAAGCPAWPPLYRLQPVGWPPALGNCFLGCRRPGDGPFSVAVHSARPSPVRPIQPSVAPIAAVPALLLCHHERPVGVGPVLGIVLVRRLPHRSEAPVAYASGLRVPGRFGFAPLVNPFWPSALGNWFRGCRRPGGGPCPIPVRSIRLYAARPIPPLAAPAAIVPVPAPALLPR